MSIVPVYNLTVGTIPPGIQGHVSPEAWRTICTVMSNADNQANCVACAIEAGVCCIFCFPLFLCHVCVANAFLDGERRK
jgi:hypothetical protein